jgi:hypothetical protein
MTRNPAPSELVKNALRGLVVIVFSLRNRTQNQTTIARFPARFRTNWPDKPA